MSERKWLVGIGTTLVLFVALVIVGIWRKKIDCDAQGGVMVRGLFETVCIKGDAVLPPSAALSRRGAE
jgi:hypothetical protein